MKHLYTYSILVMGLAYAPMLSAQNTLIGKNVKIDNLATSHAGNKMIVSMDMVLDGLDVTSNRSIVFTPFLQSHDSADTTKFTPIMVNGRKQHIMYERGNRNKKYPKLVEVKRTGTQQTVKYVDAVPYEKWMNSYKLNVAEDLCGCGNILEENTSTLLTRNGKAPLAPFITLKPNAELRKERHLEGKAYLDFPVNKTTIYPQYRKNPSELAKIVETINVVKTDKDVQIDEISIHGYASPEGKLANNQRLAEGRAQALKDYVKNSLKLTSGQMDKVQATAEDWDALRKAVADSKYTDVKGMLAIIDANQDLDAKEANLKKSYPGEYKDLLQNVYPGLRHSDYAVKYTVRPFNLEESKQVYKTKPGNLSAEEMFTLAKDAGLDTKEGHDILLTAAKLNPTNTTANLNAAQAALHDGDINTAAELAEKAGDSAEANYTQGAIKMAQGNYEAALALMQKANDGGVKEATEAINIINDYK